jgi:predicted aspartyl protease
LHGELEIEAVIDTGFSDFITLPPAVTIALDLNLHPMALLEVIESGEEAR